MSGIYKGGQSPGVSGNLSKFSASTDQDYKDWKSAGVSGSKDSQETDSILSFFLECERLKDG